MHPGTVCQPTFPGSQKAKAGYRLMMADDHFEAIKDGFKVNREGRLVAKADGAHYSGDFPYVVLLIDGAEREDLEDFQQTAATAAVLERFRPGGDSPFPLDELVDMVEAISDLKFRQKADKIQKKIEALGEGAENEEERAKLEKERDANMKHVKNDELTKEYP